MPEPGPFSKRIYAIYYARFGQWAPGLLAVLRGDPIPSDLQENAQRMRKIFLAEQARRDAEEEARPKGEVKITWVKETRHEKDDDHL